MARRKRKAPPRRVARRRPARAQRNKPPAPRSPRLDGQAWIDAALETLADAGVEAVRVEPLAKALDVTKGSFYWHFADRRALLDALLAQWSTGRIAAIREQVAGEGDARGMLLRLADLYTRHANVKGLAIELAIRAYARSDDGAAKAVRAVDTERLTHVTRLFGGLGWGLEEAQARAVLFYSYLFGQSLLDAEIATPALAQIAIDALLRPDSPRP